MATRRVNPQDLTLDSEPLVALDRRNSSSTQRAAAWVKRTVDGGGYLRIPAVVLAEVWRGRQRHNNYGLPRFLNGDRVLVDDVTSEIARLGGELLGGAGTNTTVDALVVAHAALMGTAGVLTADIADLKPLASQVSVTLFHFR